MSGKTFGNNILKTLQFGMHNAVVNGEVQREIPSTLTFVKDQTERDTLQNISAGQYVATYGIQYIWQKNGEGGWETIREAGE